MRVLLVVTRHPWPPRRGDQVRAVQMLELLGTGHEVTLLAPAAPAGAPPPADLSARLVTYRPPGTLRRLAGVVRAALWGLPLQAGLFESRDLGRCLRRLAPEADLVVLQLVRLARHMPDVPDRPDGSSVPRVVDLVDSLALSTGRRARYDRWWLRPFLRLEAAHLARWERRFVRSSAATLVVSERDARSVASRLDDASARRLRVVPVSVAAPAPAPEGSRAGSASPAPPGGRPVLAVTGNLGYFPTVEGTLWFLREVWPALRAARPETYLVLAGARPPRVLVHEARSRGAVVEPSPQSIGAVLARATLALAPMRCGAGVPLKVLEAWAAGVPVVATSWAAAGTSGRPGQDLAVADGPEGWRRAILDLLDDPARRERIAASARRRLVADYSVDAVRRRLDEALELARE
ncbi:MAG: glycosyltransferase family 4 protein [Thermoanaerobaculia bacterium]